MKNQNSERSRKEIEKNICFSSVRWQKSISLIIPAFLCLFILVTSIYAILPSIGIFDGKRLLQTGLLPCVFLLALTYPALRQTTSHYLNRTPRPIAVVLFVILVLGLISSSRFQLPYYSYVETVLVFIFIAAAFIVAGSRAVAGLKFDQLTLALIAFIGLSVLLQELMGLLANWAMSKEFSYENMFIYFSHPRFFNQFQTWSVPLIAALPAVFGSKKRLGFLALLLIAGQWYLMVASGARGSIVSITSAILVLGVFVLPMAKTWLKLHVFGALSGSALYAIVLKLQNLLASENGQFLAQSVGRELSDTTGRTWIWRFAWQDALSNPFLGSGPARFACEANAPLPGHPHNTFLQLIGEWGFPVTLMALAVILFLVWRMLKCLRTSRFSPGTHPEVLKLSLVASLMAAAIHSTVSGLLVMPASQLMAVLVGGWVIAMFVESPGSAKAVIRFPMIFLSGFVCSVLIFGFSVTEVEKMDRRLENFSETELRMPRFWQEGRICRYVYEINE